MDPLELKALHAEGRLAQIARAYDQPAWNAPNKAQIAHERAHERLLRAARAFVKAEARAKAR